MTRFTIVLGGVALAAAAVQPASAAIPNPADLDPSFGGDGIVITNVNPQDQAKAFALQADGRMVLAGMTDPQTGGHHQFDLLVARYRPGGALDRTFGGDGTVALDFGESEDVTAVAVDGTGRVVVAGAAHDSDFYTWVALTRLTRSGALDAGFSEDGRVVTRLPGGDADIAVRPDGTIVVASSGEVARYRVDGSPDPSFGGGDGRMSPGCCLIRALALQADGGILVAGQVGRGMGVARVRPDGVLDPTFGGGDGVALAGIAGGGAGDVAVAPDGKILLAGEESTATSTSPRFAVARLHPDGRRDVRWSGDGRVVTSVGQSSVASAVVVQANGKVVAGGYAHPGFALVRYTARGVLDRSFDADGILRPVLRPPGADSLAGLALQPDGRIVAGVTACTLDPDLGACTPPTSDFAMVRLLGDPACTITGTSGPDVLTGTAGSDVLCALGGDDSITGGGGDDSIAAGDGDDVVRGGPGDDVLFGGPGADTLDGGGGSDSCGGGPGIDTASACEITSAVP